MVQIHEVDPHDEPAFRAWYDALERGATAGREYPLISSYAAFVSSLRTPGPDLRRTPIVALDAAGVVGAMLLERPLKEDLQTIEVEIDVPPEFRRRGIGTALWQWARKYAAEHDRTVFQSELNIPAGQTLRTAPGGAFALKYGFESKNVEDHLVVPLPFDPALLADIENGVASAGYDVISWAGPCPPEQLDTLALMYTVMSQDVPTGELNRDAQVWDATRVARNQQRLARNYLSVISLAVARDVPAGYTEILVPHEDERNVLQESTLVLSMHRGHGLGARLKAANLRTLAGHEGPRTALHTWTEIDNTPMQRVNQRFGFTKVETLHEVETRSGPRRTL
ncbi:MAG TPA: GNAT family N-acetyltransferase [Mycobacteriales bacterium]|nr:GNAT family N-acetyltransferase [Mycobacteriales bacterium]